MRPTPHKRSKSLEDRIVKRIREGASFSDAPRIECIDEATFRKWRQCEKQDEDVSLPLRDRRCWECANCTLQRKCDEAEAHFKHYCVRIVSAAGELNWRAAAWMLEHRYRDEYTTREIVEVRQEEKLDATAELIKFITRGTRAYPGDSINRVKKPLARPVV